MACRYKILIPIEIIYTLRSDLTEGIKKLSQNFSSFGPIFYILSQMVIKDIYNLNLN